jgi:hypothetical protein
MVKYMGILHDNVSLLVISGDLFIHSLIFVGDRITPPSSSMAISGYVPLEVWFLLMDVDG